MPLLNFHYNAINATTCSSQGVLRASNPRQTNWRIKYVGWSGEFVSILRVTFPFFNATSHIQGFEDDAVAYPSTVAEGVPYFNFFTNSSEASLGTTITQYGSIATDLNIGRIVAESNTFTVSIAGFDSAGTARIIKSATVVLEYD
jgi:hypothetical protein